MFCRRNGFPRGIYKVVRDWAEHHFLYFDAGDFVPSVKKNLEVKARGSSGMRFVWSVRGSSKHSYVYQDVYGICFCIHFFCLDQLYDLGAPMERRAANGDQAFCGIIFQHSVWHFKPLLFFDLCFFCMSVCVGICSDPEKVRICDKICRCNGRGIGTSFLLWPQMYDNIFSGYRGREAFLSLSVSTDYAGALREYFQIFLGELLGGIGIVFFAVLVWGILENIIGLFWNIKNEKTKESLCWHLERKAFPTKFSFSVRVEGLYMLLTAAAVVLYVLLIAKIAPYREDRYIFNVYPASVLIFVFMAKASVERLENSSFWKKTVLVFMGMLCLSGYISPGVNYLYRGTGEKLEIMGDISAYPVFYVSENRRYRVAGDSAFLARAEYVYPVKPEDISSIPNALEVLEQQTGNSDFKEYVVYIDSEVEESEEALKAAAEMLGTKILEPLLDTEYSKVYLLK